MMVGRPGAVRVQGGDVEGHLVAVAQRQQVDLGALADVHPQVVVDHHAVGVVGGDHRAVGVFAGEHRALVAEELLAHHGLDAVGTDHQVGLDRLAVGEGQDGAAALVLDGLQLVAEVHHALGEHAQEGLDEVAAVDEVGLGLLAELRPGVLHDRLTGGGEDFEVVARRADLRDRVEDPPLAEPVHGGGTQADAGADLPHLGRLLVDVDVRAEQAQGLGRRCAAVPCADDGDLEVLDVFSLHGFISFLTLSGPGPCLGNG